jgi:hypothetical protein
LRLGDPTIQATLARAATEDIFGIALNSIGPAQTSAATAGR